MTQVLSLSGRFSFPLLVASGVNVAMLAGAAAGAPVVVGADASSADANVGIALVSKGTGALMAQVPDSTAAGGNARGANAVDWQQSRNAAVQVASGQNSTVGGGSQNTASNNYTTVGGGLANTASGDRATVAGGHNNVSDGLGSWIPGGLAGSVRGVAGRGAWGSGALSTTGDAQAGEFVLRRQGTDATPVRLTSTNTAPSGTNTVNLPNNSTYLARLMVVARQVGGSAGTVGDSAAWETTVLISRGAGGMLRPGGGGAALAPTMASTGAAAWRLDVVADTTNLGIAVSGTGEANKTINWVARVLSVEVVG